MLGAALLAALWILPVEPAEGQEPRIVELRVWVQDMHTKEDLDFLAPGSTLYMEPGDKVRLRIQAIPQGEYRRPRYPRARWTPAGSQQEVVFSEFDERVGTVVVEARRYNPNVRSGVRFQLLERMDLVRGVNPNGGLTIEVQQGHGGGYQGGGGYGNPGQNATQGENVVRALYRSILMREAEPQAVTNGARDIDYGGFEAAVRAAHNIANSRESRIEVYARGYTNEQRLLALYEELLGLDRGRINPRSWEENLRMMANGDIVGVVNYMVRTEEFRRRYGFHRGPRY
jgi:hypothetical protein